MKLKKELVDKFINGEVAIENNLPYPRMRSIILAIEDQAGLDRSGYSGDGSFYVTAKRTVNRQIYSEIVIDKPTVKASEFIEHDQPAPKLGDEVVVEYGGNPRKAYFVAPLGENGSEGSVVSFSNPLDWEYGRHYTCVIVPQFSPVVTFTKAEIAERFGIPVAQLEIID